MSDMAGTLITKPPVGYFSRPYGENPYPREILYRQGIPGGASAGRATRYANPYPNATSYGWDIPAGSDYRVLNVPHGQPLGEDWIGLLSADHPEDEVVENWGGSSIAQDWIGLPEA